MKTRSGRKSEKYVLKGVCKGRPLNNCAKSQKCKRTKPGLRKSYCRKKHNK